MSRYRWSAGVSTAAVAVMLGAGLTACGSNATANDSGDDTIRLMNITSVGATLQNYPDVKAGAQAAVDAINKAGGIGGKKIDLIFCNSQSDANKAASCARDAISDKVAAVVGMTDTFSTSVVPVLEAAHIPAIGLEPRGNPIELNSKVSYPFDGGSAGDSVAAAFGLKQAGAKAVVAVSADVPSAVANIALVKKGAELAGIKYAGSVKIPVEGVTDYAPYAQQIKALGGDSVMFNATVSQIQGLTKATAARGMKVVYAQHGTAFGVDEAKSSGSAVNGMLLVSAFPAYTDTSNEGIQRFNKEMDAAGDSDPGLKRPTAINAWLSVYAVKALVEGQGGAPAIKGAVTSAALNDALAKSGDINLLGLATWSPSKSGPADFPRVAHANYSFLKVDNGGIQPSGLSSVDVMEKLQ